MSVKNVTADGAARIVDVPPGFLFNALESPGWEVKHVAKASGASCL